MLSATARTYILGLLLCLGGCAELQSEEAAETGLDGESAELALAASEDGTDGTSSASTPAADAFALCRLGSEPLARDVLLRQVALYQAVKIPLVQDGVWVKLRPAPVVQGKEALIRAFFTLDPARVNRALRGVLTLENAGVRSTLRANLTPSRSSADAVLGSTLNFRVPAAAIGPDTKLSVALVDPSCIDRDARASDVRFPRTGTQALEATRIGKLRVVLVPMIVNGLLPDTSSAQLAALRAGLLAQYPVPDVELSVRAPVSTTTLVLATGEGWPDVIKLLSNVRAKDAPAADVHYYGLLTPKESFQSYCSAGCTTGLGFLNAQVNASKQVGIGIGYPNNESMVTMARELGHTHGRMMSPCGTSSGIDPAYPHAGGVIGVWGWDSRSSTLLPPSTADVMSFCSPSWISDYTYAAIATRSALVNTTF